MGKVSYMTVNGKIRSEHRSGEAHSRDFVHDASGNVVGVYQNGWMVADAAYEPYGGIYTQWNMESGGYRFTWMGGWGYRQTLAEWSSVYVRARHYSRSIGSWLSVDPLWPSEMAYGYVEGRVMTGMDYWGWMTVEPQCPGFCNDIKKLSGKLDNLKRCMLTKGFQSRGVEEAWRNLLSFCTGTKKVKVFTNDKPWATQVSLSLECIRLFESECNRDIFATARTLKMKNPLIPAVETVVPGHCATEKCFQELSEKYDCVILNCLGFGPFGEDWCSNTLAHELTHCGGISHDRFAAAPRGEVERDFIYNFGCCVGTVVGDNVGSNCSKHRFKHPLEKNLR